MTLGYDFGVERLKVKVGVKVNSNTAWVRTLWVPSSLTFFYAYKRHKLAIIVT